MNFDTASTFFKELVMHHRLPAEMHVDFNGRVRIALPRGKMIEQLQDEIQKMAENRGFENQSDADWLIFVG
jgi:hypothetical protein